MIKKVLSYEPARQGPVRRVTFFSKSHNQLILFLKGNLFVIFSDLHDKFGPVLDTVVFFGQIWQFCARESVRSAPPPRGGPVPFALVHMLYNETQTNQLYSREGLVLPPALLQNYF